MRVITQHVTSAQFFQLKVYRIVNTSSVIILLPYYVLSCNNYENLQAE